MYSKKIDDKEREDWKKNMTEYCTLCSPNKVISLLLVNQHIKS